MTCTASCPNPGTHRTWGECVRAKALKVGYCGQGGGGDYSAQKRWDNDLSAYRDAVRQGIEPDATSRPAVEKAVRWSNEHGKAYVA